MCYFIFSTIHVRPKRTINESCKQVLCVYPQRDTAYTVVQTLLKTHKSDRSDNSDVLALDLIILDIQYGCTDTKHDVWTNLNPNQYKKQSVCTAKKLHLQQKPTLTHFFFPLTQNVTHLFPTATRLLNCVCLMSKTSS